MPRVLYLLRFLRYLFSSLKPSANSSLPLECPKHVANILSLANNATPPAISHAMRCPAFVSVRIVFLLLSTRFLFPYEFSASAVTFSKLRLPACLPALYTTAIGADILLLALLRGWCPWQPTSLCLFPMPRKLRETRAWPPPSHHSPHTAVLALLTVVVAVTRFVSVLRRPLWSTAADSAQAIRAVAPGVQASAAT